MLQGVPHVICYIDDIGSQAATMMITFIIWLLFLNIWQTMDFIWSRTNACSSVVFLEHKIDSEGLHAMFGNVEANVSTSEHRNIQKLCSFLGLLNYYRIVLYLSTIVYPVFRKTRSGNIIGSSHAFSKAKQVHSSASILAYYDPCPHTPASDAFELELWSPTDFLMAPRNRLLLHHFLFLHVNKIMHRSRK